MNCGLSRSFSWTKKASESERDWSTFMFFIGYSKADNDPKIQGMFSNASHSNAGQSKPNTPKQHMVASRLKKRKVSNFLQSPWHKNYLQVSELCHSISVSEQEWAIATNTFCEKVDPNEATCPSKRRLVSSTHLMQQLLRPPPAFVFSGNNAASNYEIMLYLESRITLSDASSLKCHSDFDRSTNRQAFETSNDQNERYSSIIKAFVEKMHKLESDFQSLERTTSILDIILETQDLERFSVINRLAKFHSRAKTQRSAPQRYVVEIQMPKNLPEPLHCLPL